MDILFLVALAGLALAAIWLVGACERLVGPRAGRKPKDAR